MTKDQLEFARETSARITELRRLLGGLGIDLYPGEVAGRMSSRLTEAARTLIGEITWHDITAIAAAKFPTIPEWEVVSEKSEKTTSLSDF